MRPVLLLMLLSFSCGTPPEVGGSGGGSTGGEGGGGGTELGDGGNDSSSGGAGGGATSGAGGGTPTGGAGGGATSGAGGGTPTGGAGGAGGGHTGKPGDFTRSLMHGGVQRSFRVHASAASATGRVPLVLVLHGYTETASLIQLQTGFDAVANARGWITVYPQGVSNSWNGGGTCCGTAVSQNVDDVGFLRAVINALKAEYSIDDKRVHVTGMSNGGFMAHRAACELSDLIASAASCAGQLQRMPCTPSRPVPIVQMHGTSDAIVPYTGIWYPSTDATMKAWATRNGCSSQTPTRTGTSGSVSTDEWPCPATGRVVLHTVTNGSHTWFQPSASNPGATRTFADFFDANPMP